MHTSKDAALEERLRHDFTRAPWYLFAFAFVAIVAVATMRLYAASDVVLYTSDFSNIQGSWSAIGSGSGAGGQVLPPPENGSPTATVAGNSPSDYVEATFNAASYTPYHVWLRLRATGSSKFNDS